MTTVADSDTVAAAAAAAAALELPAFPEDVTAAWLSEILGSRVKSVKIERTMPGTATKVFVAVVFENDGPDASPIRLCVKGGFDPDLIKQMPWIVKIYQREAEFYSRVAPLLADSMELPRSWWAGQSATQGVVVLEDIGATGGCAFGTPVETWPVARVLAGVEQLAALHARTWHVRTADMPWLTSDYDEALLALMETYGDVVSGPDRPPIPTSLRDQARVGAVLRRHYASRNPRFRCLLHGDAHTGNTYLTGEGAAPRFLDWQVIHIGSAFHDVAYFVGGALSIEDRRAREWDIVDHYLRMLERFGVPGPRLSRDEEEVVKEYKKSFLAGVGWIMCPYEMQPRECVRPMALRYAAALDDHNVLELVEGLPEPEGG